MEWPIVAPAPIVTAHAVVFRDLFEHQWQFRHVQHSLTGLSVLPNKSLANMARGILDSADNTNRSRLLSEAPWREQEVNRRRIRCMLQPTKPHRRRRHDALVVIDDTLCEHVGSLFAHGDRHDNHGDGPYPLAHHPVTSCTELVPLIPANAYRPVKVPEQPYWCFTLALRLPGLGKVRLVVSVEHESVPGRSVVLVTNRVDWSAVKSIGLYLQRWPTETFYQDGQGPLGCDTERMRSTEALGKHWCLVFVASSLLHRTCLPAVPDRTKGLMQTMGDACRQQGRALIQKLLLFVHDQLSHGATADHVFAQLFAKQRGMVPG
jgi:hypothetical protein